MIPPVSVKEGASIIGVSPELVLGLLVIAEIFRVHGVPLCITEATGGKHGPGTLHHIGNALDLRLPSRYTQTTRDDGTILYEIAQALGQDWDCVLEPDHYHIELDPHRKAGAA
jgi:hypothetical protein